MYSVRLLIPIAIYAAIALMFLISNRRLGPLLALVTVSYCGVVAFTPTRGATGAIFLPHIFLLLIAPAVLSRRGLPAGASSAVTTWTWLLLGMFGFGVLVGFGRFSSEVTAAMAGQFTGVAGIPLSVLMTGYRIFVLVTLALALLIPLKFTIDRAQMLRILTVCWLFSLVLAALQFVEYFEIADVTFDVSSEAVGESDRALGRHRVVLGFRRAALGLMFVAGLFFSYGMTQLSRSYVLRALAWASAPALMIALLFSWSRAAVIGMAAGSIALIVTMGGVRAIRGVILTIFGVIVIWSVLGQFEDAQDRFIFFQTGEIRESGHSRLEGWQMLTEYLFRQADVLIFGAGFQNFQYAINVTEGAVQLTAGHNVYLHTLAELGVAGFIVFIGWVVAVFVWLIRWRSEIQDNVTKVMAGVFMALFVGVLASGLTQESLMPTPSVTNWILHFYLMLGIWVSWYRTEHYQRSFAQAAAPQPTPTPAELARSLQQPGDAVVYQ